ASDFLDLFGACRASLGLCMLPVREPLIQIMWKAFWVVFLHYGAVPLALASQAGRDWGIERQAYLDPATGVRVWDLTKPPYFADNLYFHFSNFTAHNRFLIFVSERGGSRQLCRCEVATGRIVQLTDDPTIHAATGCPDPTNPRRLYCLRGP